jgi:hypothetical protein
MGGSCWNMTAYTLDLLTSCGVFWSTLLCLCGCVWPYPAWVHSKQRGLLCIHSRPWAGLELGCRRCTGLVLEGLVTHRL